MTSTLGLSGLRSRAGLVVCLLLPLTAQAEAPPAPRELGDLLGWKAWRSSDRKGEEAPASPRVVSPGLAGSGRAGLFRMRGYNSKDNTGAEHTFPRISGERIVLEMVVRPSSDARCLAVSLRDDGEAAAYIRFNGRKPGWVQQYDESSQYRDVASYEPNRENLLKVELNTGTHTLKAWVNGQGGEAWNFRAPVTDVNRLDLFMTHGNGPEVSSVVDNIVVRDDAGKVVFAEDFEAYDPAAVQSRPATRAEDAANREASAPPPALTGDIGISPSGHYVTYKGRALMLIGDSGTQCVTQNTNIDYRAWIDDCAARGIPMVQVWSFKSPKQKQDGSLVEDRYGYVYPGITPWRRKEGGPPAMDQLAGWDLQTFDEGADGDATHYWPRLRDLCRYAKSKNIMVGITVFFGWPKHNTSERPDWAYHPLNVLNGGPVSDSGRMATRVQMIDSPGREIWEQPFSREWGAAKQNQWIWEQLCKKLIDDLGPLGNVFFAFMDEHSYSEGNGGDHFLAFFTRRGQVWADWDQRRPALSFVFSNTDGNKDKNRNAVRGFQGKPARPYLLLEGPPYRGDDVRTSLWTFSVGGGHYTFHGDEEQETPQTGIMGYDPHVPGGDKGMVKRDWLGHAARFFNREVADLDALAPHNGLCDAGVYCLANPGREYVVYVRRDTAATFKLDMREARGSFNCRFYNPRTGEFEAAFSREGGGVQVFSRPDSQDWVLHVVRKAS